MATTVARASRIEKSLPLNHAAKERAHVKQKAPLQLPLWADLERAIPNHLARSSLFAPIARGKRKLHDKTKLASRGDVQMFVSGKQLDEADCDVFMQSIHEARRVPLGDPVFINRAEFLRAIGRNTGKRDYQWLHESFERLSFAMLSIDTKRYAIGTTTKSRVMHLIDGFDHDPDRDAYTLRIDPRMLALYSNNEFALVDWDKRRKIEHQADMAKWLQRLIATSKDRVQRYALDDLKERMQYASPMRLFRPALMRAMLELDRLEILAAPRIELSTRKKLQAVWTRLD